MPANVGGAAASKRGHSKPVDLVRPFLAGPAGSPRSGTRLVGTGPKGHPVPAGPRFSSLKIAPGGTLPSASKGANQIHLAARAVPQGPLSHETR